MTLDPNQILLKSEIGRISEINYVARFNQNFGYEDGVFEFLLSQKDLWADKLFYVPEEQFTQWVKSESHPVKDVPTLKADQYISDYELQEITKEEFISRFHPIDNVDIKVTKSGLALDCSIANGESAHLKESTGRESVAINVGGRVTSLKWTHYTSTSYLAVSILGGESDLEKLVADPNLSIFPDARRSKGALKAAIQIWEYDHVTSSLVLNQVIDTSAFGTTSCLRWVPAHFELDVIGILSAVFTDGNLHFFKIRPKTPGHQYHEATKSSHMISATKQRREDKSSCTPITAFDFVDHLKVVIGTFDGSIAEYVIPDPATDDGSASIPSFNQFVSDASVKSVTVGRVGAAHVILIHSMGNQSFAFHYENMRLGRADVTYTNSLVRPTYCENLRCFVYPDSAESFSIFFARHPQLKGSLIMKSELISSFHTSEFLSHPFAIVGNVLGQVFVVNMSRRIFALPKGQLKFVNPLKIWTLHKSSDGSGLVLNGDYELVPSDRSSVMYTFTPPEIVISAAAWNENINGSSVYAIGTYSGLLVVEKLDTGK